jgi:hypothetical protein
MLIWATKRPQSMAIRLLSLIALSVLSGCTTERLVHDLVVPECEAHGDKPKSRAAACMTGAAYEIARKRGEEARHETGAGQN